MNYSNFICPFKSGKCGSEGKKLEKFGISKIKRAFKMEWKAFFIVFERLSLGEKIKNYGQKLWSVLDAKS